MTRAGTAFAVILSAAAGVLAGYFIWGPGARLPLAPDLAAKTGFDASAVTIASTDFAIVPCEGPDDRGSCVIIAAGGKRVLVGAPSGIGAKGGFHLAQQDKTLLPDAVLLFSLEARQIEGLDEIRNLIWESGALQPVPLAGGEGIEEISAGLDNTFTVPDAVAYVNGVRQGDFNARPLVSRALRHGDVAFDTGDLKISALAGGASQLAYLVEYGGEQLVLADCGAGAEDIRRWPQIEHYLGCHEVAEAYDARSAGVWPLEAPVFILKSD